MPTKNTEPDAEQQDWFGAYAPENPITNAPTEISWRRKHRVEDVAVGMTEAGEMVIDFDMVTGDTVRVVLGKQKAEKIPKLFARQQDKVTLPLVPGGMR